MFDEKNLYSLPSHLNVDNITNNRDIIDKPI